MRPRKADFGTRGTISTSCWPRPTSTSTCSVRGLAHVPRPFVERIYLLVSADDAALRVSRRIAGGVPRVGAADTAELEKLGVTVIDLSQISDLSSGSHSKFAGSPEVVKLIGAGLNSAGRFGETSTPTLAGLLGGAPITILGN